jgi:hypothetical protein
VAGEGDKLAEVANRVLSIARSLDDELPLSRKQNFDREYLPHEQGKK